MPFSGSSWSTPSAQSMVKLSQTFKKKKKKFSSIFFVFLRSSPNWCLSYPFCRSRSRSLARTPKRTASVHTYSTRPAQRHSRRRHRRHRLPKNRTQRRKVESSIRNLSPSLRSSPRTPAPTAIFPVLSCPVLSCPVLSCSFCLTHSGGYEGHGTVRTRRTRAPLGNLATYILVPSTLLIYQVQHERMYL
ncbi:hypothetical protein JOL62DRAFT_235194 [Phyllosticta paracitricarpa]|uniref:Uncharacterized protein n=1 Tax=Phyllosticta paracitricarpa TaxID=2016321 RepID=A0ABR1NI33_9PEZI